MPGSDGWENKIFHASFYNFEAIALEMFRFQYYNNEIYRKFAESLHIDPLSVNSVTSIPFLPVQVYKSQEIKTTPFDPMVIFESSGTTGGITSRHFVKDTELYRKNLQHIFNLFYGDPADWCIIGLLPSYLERTGSSLVFMVQELLSKSGHALSGFYLNDHEKLYQTLLHNEILGQKTLLLGVTFALLDFSEKYRMKLSGTVVMETGGMKGRREEMTREKLHSILSGRLGVKTIHSEYGMTEMLSQAYSRKDGRYKCPPWMKVLIREADDPLYIHNAPKAKIPLRGVINIIDLANIYSCAFLATDDIGNLYNNGEFEVLGRIDASDTRGCSLMTV